MIKIDYIVTIHTCKEAIWLGRFLRELKVKLNILELHCDSQSTVYSAKNLTFYFCTKHINVHFHIMQNIVEDSQVLLLKIYIDVKPMDILMKIVTREKFN